MTESLLRVAAVQMVSTPSVDDNIATAKYWIAQAAHQGAKLVLLPEYWAEMGKTENSKIMLAEEEGKGKIQACMATAAREHGIWLIGGTLPLAATRHKVFNSMMVYDDTGTHVLRYDKMHLFCFSHGEESYDEARTIAPGSKVGVVPSPFGRIGLSVCYDLRFPELYRAMGDCVLMVVAAAFTNTTGRAHWETLLRARAIENQCYVLAAAQGGQHVNGRTTWGHSMLVDPWGNICAVKDEGAGLVVGEMDFSRLLRIRQNLPALSHRCL